jgi:hypothetical protein
VKSNIFQAKASSENLRRKTISREDSYVNRKEAVKNIKIHGIDSDDEESENTLENSLENQFHFPSTEEKGELFSLADELHGAALASNNDSFDLGKEQEELLQKEIEAHNVTKQALQEMDSKNRKEIELSNIRVQQQVNYYL